LLANNTKGELLMWLQLSVPEPTTRSRINAARVLLQLHDIHGTGRGHLETQRGFSPRMAFFNKLNNTQTKFVR
jgi:hypothetical protein